MKKTMLALLLILALLFSCVGFADEQPDKAAEDSSRAEYTVENGDFVYDMNEQRVTGKINHTEGTAELETVYARVCFFYRNKTWASFVLEVRPDGTFKMGANTEALYITVEIVDNEDATGIPDDEDVYGSGRGVVIPVED